MRASIKVIPSAICALVAAAWVGTTPAPAADHYVRPPGTCTNTELQYPYASWADAATNIQWAVDAADFTETVWVTNGAYCVTNEITVTNNIVLRSVNGWTNTLVYAGWPTWTTRIFHVARTGVVDGFTVSNGYTVGRGGGAYVPGPNAMLRNCYFVNNASTNDHGGALWVGGSSTISNCLVVSNSCYGKNGGGIYLDGGSILGCSIISNRATSTGNGGGIYNDNGYGHLISDCLIAYNSGYSGGGIGGAYYNVTRCVVSNNTAAGGRGGGVYGANAGYSITDSTIVNNTGGNQYGGGGIHLYRGTWIVSNCIIAGNTSIRASGGGVLAQSDQATFYASLDSCRIYNNLLAGSRSDDAGGAGMCLVGRVLARNCLVFNNTNGFGGVSAARGGGIFVQGASTAAKPWGIVNCTIANNWSTNEGGGIVTSGVSNSIINSVVAGNSSCSGNYPNVYHFDNFGVNSSNYWYTCAVTTDAFLLAATQGNILKDPVFVNQGSGDYRLSSDSPCVDTGFNQDWMTNAVDIDGGPRIRYGTVDMGACEFIYSGTFYTFH